MRVPDWSSTTPSLILQTSPSLITCYLFFFFFILHSLRFHCPWTYSSVSLPLSDLCLFFTSGSRLCRDLNSVLFIVRVTGLITSSFFFNRKYFVCISGSTDGLLLVCMYACFCPSGVAFHPFADHVPLPFPGRWFRASIFC
jgi:hypothetical protein